MKKQKTEKLDTLFFTTSQVPCPFCGNSVWTSFEFDINCSCLEDAELWECSLAELPLAELRKQLNAIKGTEFPWIIDLHPNCEEIFNGCDECVTCGAVCSYFREI